MTDWSPNPDHYPITSYGKRPGSNVNMGNMGQKYSNIKIHQDIVYSDVYIE